MKLTVSHTVSVWKQQTAMVALMRMTSFLLHVKKQYRILSYIVLVSWYYRGQFLKHFVSIAS